ncbi:tyrosine-type recombinase/integrase [Muribaculum intestinale]|uniref:tyrosine-type recombinase/integrase n=1 Tax=Muribaculum intestinale TaxID=1796646 RepID=UPI00262682A6|nr:tyrosine-type recombinase/integrase [Muribaculum intestinale]
MRKPSPQAIAISRILGRWLDIHLPSIKAASPHSIRSYKTSIALYMDYLEANKGIDAAGLDASCFCSENITDWVKWLGDIRHSTPVTCNIRLAALRSFLRYLGECDIAFTEAFLQCRTVPNQKAARPKVAGISTAAVKHLMEIPDHRSARGLRNLTMILTAYSCALRITELLTLKIGNVNLRATKPYITVTGKGRKIRTIPLTSKPAAYLERYISSHPAKGDLEAYVFYSKTKGVHVPMTARNFDKMLKACAAKAGMQDPEIPLTLHAHQLRHARASHWLENGMNLAQISHLLGHESIQTTMVYLDVTTEQESKALETLENESQRKIAKKWKSVDNTTLASIMGLK